MIDKDFFQKRFDRYSSSRSGGLTDTKLLARLESVSELLGETLCIDGGDETGEDRHRLEAAWNNLLGALGEIHSKI